MEFSEKLQELRKSRGLTQEELAEMLYVSRTAISKWESGRGYPSIESLKQISVFFSVTIDELLSGEKLVQIAEIENKTNIQSLCELLIGIADILSFMLIILPLYPKSVNGYIYAVSLFNYDGLAPWIIRTYWVIYIALVITGIAKVLMNIFKIERGIHITTILSLVLGILSVLFLALTRESYAIVLVFILLAIKCGLLYKRNRIS